MCSFVHPPVRVTTRSSLRGIARGSLSLMLAGTIATDLSAQRPDEPFAFDRATRWYDLASPLLSTGYGVTQGVALTDIDNDGTRDVVRMSLNRVEFLRGAGSGFRPPTTFLPTAFGYIGEAMSVDDVTGDGIDDLVIAGTRQAAPYPMVIQALTGDGLGGFTPGPVTQLPWGQAFVVKMRTADLDGDGRADVVLSNQWYDEVLIRLSGGQTQTLTLAAGAEIRSFEIGDVDNDGLRDLVLLVDDPTTGNGGIDVRRNQGGGAFPATGQTWSDGLVSGMSQSVLALDDFDGDGSLDVVVPLTSQQGNRVVLALLQNDGTGAFASSSMQPVLDDDHVMVDVDAVDLDADGDHDLVLSAHYVFGFREVGIVSTVLNDGGGGFTVRSTCAVIADDVEFDVNAATGERRLIDANLHVFPVARDGSIAPVPSVPPSAPFTRNAVLDFDRDGRDDIAVYDMETRLVSIHLSDGARGTWSTVSFQPTAFPLALSFEAADVDGDGWRDLVLHCQDRVVTLRNVAGQSLQQVETDLATGPALCSRQYEGAGLGDIDGDGRTDFVRVARYTTDAVVGFGTVNGDFATECLQLPNWMNEVALGDVTGDGLADLVMVPRGAGSLYVFAGTGQVPPFAAPVQTTFSVPVREDVVLGDLDGDGDLDVVAVGGPRFVVGLNDGAGQFVESQRFSMTRGSFDHLELADMNGDGQPDLIARGVWLGSHTLVLRNDGGVLQDDRVRWDWSASVLVESTVATDHHWGTEQVVGDFDADGAPDLIVGGVFQDATIDHTQVFYNRSQLRGFGYAKAGEAMTLELRQPAAPNALYVLLLGQSGSWPGVQLTPTVHLPLNAPLPLLDFYLAGGAGVFVDFIGLLDGDGCGDARLAIPPGFVPGAPIDLDMAMVTVDLATFELRTSNSMTVRVE